METSISVQAPLPSNISTSPIFTVTICNSQCLTVDLFFNLSRLRIYQLAVIKTLTKPCQMRARAYMPLMAFCLIYVQLSLPSTSEFYYSHFFMNIIFFQRKIRPPWSFCGLFIRPFLISLILRMFLVCESISCICFSKTVLMENIKMRTVQCY